MVDSLLQISLLYELSLTNMKYFKPKDNARNFIKKLISRKALNSGAIWLFKHMEDDIILCKKLYSMPNWKESETLSVGKISGLFLESDIALVNESIFEDNPRKGFFAYFKLNDIGILELYSSVPERLDHSAVYPLKDVVDQLAVGIESGFSYQKLQSEIRQRKQAERLLTANEKKYRNIIDNINLGLLEVDKGELITYANEAFLELVQYPLDELVGKKASDLLIDEETSDRLIRVNREAQNRLNGSSHSYEMPIKDKSGKRKWVIISGAPSYDDEGNLVGSIGIHLDITEQKKLIEENAFKDTRIKKLFDISLDALISINDKGEIFEWSTQAEKIFGFTEEEAMGKRLTDTIIPSQHIEGHNDGMKTYINTGSGPVLNSRIEITALRKNGEEFPIELTVFPLQFNEKHFFTAFVRDITELKASKASMEKALERQKELNELKSKFISMISHELRTPLTTISTNSELVNYQLEHGEINRDRLLKNMGRIENNVERLIQLINNILIIGKLDVNKVKLETKPSDLEALIMDAILPNLTVKKQPKVVVNGQKYNVDVDRRLFIHIMNNLIENAFKYSPDGGTPEVFLEYRNEKIEIKVKDYGIGIPKEDQKRLFETFYRASNVDNIQGTGLGLSIVKEYVQLHGGSISVESEENQGTIFSILLPK